MADINLGVGGANSASDAYEITNSLKLEEGATEYLTRTPSSAGNEKLGLGVVGLNIQNLPFHLRQYLQVVLIVEVMEHLILE